MCKNLNVTNGRAYRRNAFTEAEKERSRSTSNTLRVFKDIRIFANTIKQAVDMMKQSGIDATAQKNENDEFIEYIIRIPK